MTPWLWPSDRPPAERPGCGSSRTKGRTPESTTERGTAAAQAQATVGHGLCSPTVLTLQLRLPEACKAHIRGSLHGETPVASCPVAGVLRIGAAAELVPMTCYLRSGAWRTQRPEAALGKAGHPGPPCRHRPLEHPGLAECRRGWESRAAAEQQQSICSNGSHCGQGQLQAPVSVLASSGRDESKSQSQSGGPQSEARPSHCRTLEIVGI